VKATYTNELAVILLCTKKEYELGLVKKCLDRYFLNENGSIFSLDLFIYFNQGSIDDYADLLKYKSQPNINEIYIHSFNYTQEQDLYIRSPKHMKELRIKNSHFLGGSGGANLLFYDSLIPSMDQSYENYLMIESDSRPLSIDWVSKLMQAFRKTDFLVFGSTYKGSQLLPSYECWTGHLNGVAVYKKNEHTKHLLLESRQLIKYHVRHNINKFISFDVGIWMYTQTLNWRNYLKNNNINFKPLIDSEVISNYSLYTDINLSESEILKRNPKTIILHQKWN
jgi:hypothetical protein